MGLLAVEIRWHRLRIRTQERKGRRYGALEMSERIDYRGYRVEIGPVGKGWRPAIYAPGSATPLLESPSMLEKSSEDNIVTEAKSIIDARLNG